MFTVLVQILLLTVVSSFDLYFVRHGARSPLSVDMRDLFGVPPQELTGPGKIQSYFYGKQLRSRHTDIKRDQLKVYSTQTQRTRMTGQYFIKGWHGIQSQGNVKFQPTPYYLPPSNLSYIPEEERWYVNEFEYAHEIYKIPAYEDTTSRTYQRYDVSDAWSDKILRQRILADKNLCAKFQESIPSSCSRQSMDQFFNFADIVQCLRFANKQMPCLSEQEMRLPQDIVNNFYNLQFRTQSFPTRSVQQDFLLVQEHYSQNPEQVVVVFTHDAQLLFDLRSLLGVGQLFGVLGGNMTLEFLSSLHFKLEGQSARIYLNDRQLFLPGCSYQRCSVGRLFHIMNS